MRIAAAVLLLLMAAPVTAQVQTRATDPPSVTAVNESWFQLGEPLQLGGELYFRAGATVFFGGNRMARIGHYNGIPLYADTTVEPYSVVLVPVTRGLLQPYERPRRGDLAGTTGSGAPAFPVYPVPQSMPPTAAAAPPTGLPAPIGGVSAFTQNPTAAAVPASVDAAAVSTAAPEPGRACGGQSAAAAEQRRRLDSVRGSKVGECRRRRSACRRGFRACRRLQGLSGVPPPLFQ